MKITRYHVIGGAGLATLIATGVIVGHRDDMTAFEDWQKFAKEHNCQLMLTQSSGQSIDDLAVLINESNGKAGWLCDDRMIYWRPVEEVKSWNKSNQSELEPSQSESK